MAVAVAGVVCVAGVAGVTGVAGFLTFVGDDCLKATASPAVMSMSGGSTLLAACLAAVLLASRAHFEHIPPVAGLPKKPQLAVHSFGAEVSLVAIVKRNGQEDI